MEYEPNKGYSSSASEYGFVGVVGGGDGGGDGICGDKSEKSGSRDFEYSIGAMGGSGHILSPIICERQPR